MRSMYIGGDVYHVIPAAQSVGAQGAAEYLVILPLSHEHHFTHQVTGPAL